MDHTSAINIKKIYIQASGSYEIEAVHAKDMYAPELDIKYKLCML